MSSMAVRTGTPSDPELPPATQVSPVRLSMRVATTGLVVVMAVLTVFSVTVSVTNSSGTERAQRAAAESDLFEQASEALLAQEETAEEVVEADSAEGRGEYAAADRATLASLQALVRTETPTFSDREVRALVAEHDRYNRAVLGMFDVAVGGAGAAELYEDTYVDPHFDPLAETLAEQVKLRYEEARAALRSVARAQQLLQIATPALFAVALALITTFFVMLARSRRLVVVQADANRYQSLHDALTGLPNRTVLHGRGASCLERSTMTGLPVALMLLDLDRFKEINDTLGHHHGDLVLQTVSERLCKAVRTSDVVVRLGGDEFAILLPEVQDIVAALNVATKVQEALHASLDVGGILLDVDISMGVVMSGMHGDTMEVLLQHADIAMYRAKENDLGVCVYDDELNEHSRDQLGLLGELRRAIDQDELILHFQPKVDLHTGQLYGAEALLRWEHPTRGLIPPGLFIPAAERTALIRPLTAWVLNAALAECKRWQDQGKHLRLAVNVSARNLLDASFGDDVLDLLTRWDLPASCLLLEVTESAIMIDPERAESILRRFSRIGIEIAIDDFGAGYTSLAHLRTLPVTELKLDQSLVRQMSMSTADSLIIGAIIELAHGLGLRTVAEGVEDADTLRRLTALGCDVAQGYHLARPMPAAELSAWRPEAQRATEAADRAAAGEHGDGRLVHMHAGGAQAALRDLQPSDVVMAAQTIAAMAAAEVAADAAVTAQAAVTAAYAAALHAATKAERVAAQAADAAAAAAAILAMAPDLRHPRSQWDGTAVLTGLLCHRDDTADGAARHVVAGRTAEAAASAARKVAAQVVTVAAATAVEGASAAGLIELQLAEDAAVTAESVAASTPSLAEE